MKLCGAQVVVDLVGGIYANCDRYVDTHQHKGHRDSKSGHEWPACSQHCLQDHGHGAYRIKLGAPVGPASAAGRQPKRGKPGKAPGRACSICLEPSEPDQLEHGRCKDQEACLSRAPRLDLGMEPPNA